MRWFRRGRRGDDGDQLPLDDAPPPPLPSVQRFTRGDGRIYRVVRIASGKDARGRSLYRSGVGVSDVSAVDAEVEARARAERAVAAALSGRESAGGYAYQADRRLEPDVESIRGPAGEVARVTVNAYGSLVINAQSAMFVDVDTGDEIDEPRDIAVPEDLVDLVARRADLGFRVYRTLAGWRYLCTTATFDPASDEVHTLLTELGSDEKYIALCRRQRTFRARITPKPWRAKRWPLTPGVSGLERSALADLIQRTWKFATARYITSAGSSVMSPDVRPVVEYHDRWAQAHVMKPLA